MGEGTAMACKPESKSAEAAGGCCGGGCGAPKPFPWFSALCDPTFQKLFLARYGRHLLTGLAAGGLGALALLAPGEALARLGPLLGGPWLHLRAAAVVPATLLAGLFLALGATGPSRRTTLALRMLVCLALGGIANGLLELDGAFLSEGGWAYPLAFGLLGLPATWAGWWILDRPGRDRTPF